MYYSLSIFILLISFAVAELSSTSLPSGRYVGEITKARQTIRGDVNVNDNMLLDMVISGAIEVECAQEAFDMNNNEIDLIHSRTVGDCIHDKLEEYEVTLEEVSYDEDLDEITVSVKYSVMNLDIILKKEKSILAWLGELIFYSFASSFDEGDAVDYNYIVDSAAAEAVPPQGVFHGEKSFLGQKMTATVVLEDDDSNMMKLHIDGSSIETLDCNAEAYTFLTTNGEFDLLDITKEGDCAHDGLEENGASFKSMVYEQKGDSIDVTLKHGRLQQTMTLHRKKTLINVISINEEKAGEEKKKEEEETKPVKLEKKNINNQKLRGKSGAKTTTTTPPQQFKKLKKSNFTMRNNDSPKAGKSSSSSSSSSSGKAAVGSKKKGSLRKGSQN